MTSSFPGPLRLDDGVTVGRLRVRLRAGADAGAARQRMERLLSGDALDVPGLPRASILCVRDLRDPRPRSLSLDPLAESRGWAEAVRSRLAEVARGAARPFDGPVPGSTAAVIFRDRAELLACLARDWMRGLLQTAWWWRALIPTSWAADRLVPRQWTADVRSAPAAARILADRGLFVPFADALGVIEAAGIALALGAAFGIDVETPVEAAESTGAGRAIAFGAPESASAGETWKGWVPEGAQAPEGPVRALVVLALGLARAPSVVRGGSTAGAIRRWMTAAAHEHPGGGGAPPAPPLREHAVTPTDSASPEERRTALRSEAPETPPRPEGAADAGGSVPSAEVVDRPAVLPVASAPSSAPVETGEEALDANDATHGGAAVESPEGAPGARGAPRATSGQPAPQHDDAIPLVPPTRALAAATETMAAIPSATSATAAPGTVVPVPPAPQAAMRATATARQADGEAPYERVPQRSATTATRYGGLFFLLNAFVALGLYGDFSRPRLRALAPSPWRLLARVGRALLGADVEPGDGVWALLDDLAGPIDEAEHWPEAWRAEPRWLDPFPERQGWTWHLSEGRIQLRHPGGFLVVDVPAEADAGAQRAREVEPFGADPTIEAEGIADRGGWPDHLATFLAARVHAAIRASDVETSVRLLVAMRARVVVTETTVDVRMALAELPIETRFAGFDRDLGWLPAAGRSIAFHFD